LFRIPAFPTIFHIYYSKVVRIGSKFGGKNSGSEKKGLESDLIRKTGKKDLEWSYLSEYIHRRARAKERMRKKNRSTLYTSLLLNEPHDTTGRSRNISQNEQDTVKNMAVLPCPAAGPQAGRPSSRPERSVLLHNIQAFLRGNSGN
jgi:hypothetical protein